MAGKKIASKKKAEADGPQSKTARSSMAKKGKKEGFVCDPIEDRIISLNGGRNAYVLDPRDGKTHHLEVHSEKWMRLIGELLVSEHSQRINEELIRKGWGDTYVLASGQAV